jgi:threonine dehydrogenase-like Zn-dependent dehydrogenase
MNDGRHVVVTAVETAECMPCSVDETPLGPHEVFGSTLATLISAGTELSGGYLGDSFPVYPGYASVFRVERIGSEVSEVEVGDICFTMGPHRSYQRADEGSLCKLPSGLSPHKAVFARMMCVSMSTLTTTTARPPQKVLVMGLGAVGHLAARMFQASGYEVIGCDPLKSRRDIAREYGVSSLYDSVPFDDPSIVDHVALVLECSGHEGAALDGCRVVRRRGEVVLVGTPWRRHTDLVAHEIVHAVFHRYVVLRSGWEWELPTEDEPFRVNSILGNIRAAMSWIADGRIDVDNLATLLPPEAAQEVYQSLLYKTAPRLAVVFDWTA